MNDLPRNIPGPPDRPTEAPYLGVGVGLRPTHYPELLRRLDAGEPLGVDWFEALTENYMIPGGRPPHVLERTRRAVPIALHGVSLNIGSTDPLNGPYLDQLETLIERFEPSWVSDHLCWTGVGGHNLHDLVPLPYTEAVVGHVADRIARVQDQLGRRIALENVSSYLVFDADAMPEWEFLMAVSERADCGILLDVNNVFVSAHNHGFEAEKYLDAIAPERVFQVHLAGHSESGLLLIDTHDHPIRNEVWALFEHAIRRMGRVSTLIEWDDHIPPFEQLIDEAQRARTILERVAREEEIARGPHQRAEALAGDLPAAAATPDQRA